MSSFQQIIDHKIRYLAGEINDDITAAMQTEIDNNPLLAKEIAFIESVWQPQLNDQLPLPSATLDKQFYAMLNTAKAQQKTAQSNKTLTLPAWLNWRLGLQAVAMAGCFVLGVNLNRPALDLTALNTEVQSLKSLVAHTMLTQSQASERLSGVQYTLTSQSPSPELTQALLTTMTKDDSASVKLAALNALASKPLTSIQLEQLSGLVIEQRHPLVQLTLVNLIIKKGGLNQLTKLMESKPNDALHPDTLNLLTEQQQAKQI